MHRTKDLRLRSLIVLWMALCIAGCTSNGGDKASGTTSSSSSTTLPTSTSSSPSTAMSPPTSSTIAANAGAWSLIPAAPNPIGQPVAWTGSELLVAQAGCCAGLGSVNLTAFNPHTRAWHPLPPTPLTPRESAVGVWTGTEMVVAGGLASPDGNAEHASAATDGAAWVAATDTWHAIAPMPTTLPIGDPTAVWTGREVLVWSSAPATPDSSGREVVLAYDPSTNTWRTIPPSGLTPRFHSVVVWTGTELVVWGGLNSDFTVAYGDGARLNPADDIWKSLPPAPVPARGQATAVWSGKEVLLWGGDTGVGTEVGQGAAYDPTTNTWRKLPLSPLRAKTLPAGVWTGRLFLVIGGSAGGALPAPGPGAAAYDPATNSWTVLPAAPDYPPGPFSPTFTADQREGGSPVWTGRSVLLVGGLDYRQQAPRSDGVEWSPSA